ncbi:tetratricopeptide repeat protein [Zobellella sp. DQSA1]|uniref:tetratricopeptide repeat protein n=1 Tax=Zobellella sp. DQSA1 TaxID=3342386 RepID=UPI0035C1B94A
MVSNSRGNPLKKCLILVGVAVTLSACATSTSKETLRFCDDTGCSERSSSSATADYLDEPPVVKSEQILKLEEAASSDPRAAYDLALRYFRGDGIQRNSYQALQWMRKAGESGLLHAQQALGGYYLSGLEEMGSDPQEAEKWLSMAAAQGDQESASLLAEAAEAKQREAGDYRWRQHWREYYRGYWYRGYSYFGYWRQGYWYY